jgi:predicted nucleotidyltransferase
MRLQKDLREFIESLNSHRVEFVIVGGYALAFHGHPRYTRDIDILLRATPENAARVESALSEFGFTSLGLSALDFLKPGQVIQLGHPPNRIDLLTSLSGVDAEEVWGKRLRGELDGLPVSFIDKESFLRNKHAAGRPQDLADASAIE